MPLTFPDNPQIGQTVEYSFPHSGLAGQTGDEVTRLWTWNGPTMGWVSNGTRQLDYITRTEAIDIFVNESGDTMTGTLTGPHLNFDTGFIGTLTGNYIDIPSLGDFGSQIRVASNSSLGMPYFSGSMHSLDLWSRLHLIGGGGQTGYSLRITTSAAGSTIEDSQGKMIFDQGFTHGVAISPYGINDIVDSEFDDPIAGISFFGINLYTGQNNRTDTSMPYQGVTNNDYSGMLSLEMDGRGYIPRMFSTRRGDLLNTFDDDEFITKQYGEDNFGSGAMTILTDPTDHPATSTSPAIFRTLRIFKMRKPNGDLLTYQLDDTYLYFNDDYDSGRYGRYYVSSPQIIELQNTEQIPNFGWASLNQNLDGDVLFTAAGLRRQSEYQISGPGTKYYYSGDVGNHETVPSGQVWYFLASSVGGFVNVDATLKNSSAHIQIMTYSD